MERNYIKLIKEIDKDGNPKYQTYVTPGFIPFSLLYDSTDIMEGLEDKSEKEAMDAMLDLVVRIYNNQFTREDLINGLNAPDAVEEIQSQIAFLSEGKLAEERKAELKEILK